MLVNPSSGSYFGLAAANGTVYLSDVITNAVYKVSGGTTTLFAGTPNSVGFSGDSQLATTATLNRPLALTLSSSALYIVDGANGCIRRVDLASNIITTVAGTGTGYYTADGAPPVCSPIWPLAAAVDSHENLFVPDATGRIFEMSNLDSPVPTSVPELIDIVPSNQNLSFSIDGNAFTTAQKPTWTLGANHTLQASPVQNGSPDGYSYGFVGWSDPTLLGTEPVVAACPATYTALYGATGCTFTLSHTQANFDSHANVGYFIVNAPPEATCSWVAQSSVNWITVTGHANGSGSGVVTFSISAYTNPPPGAPTPRTGSITVGGQTFTITQYPSGECNYSTTTAPYTGPFFSWVGSTADFFFLNLVGNCFGPPDIWTVSADQPWVALPAITTGSSSTNILVSLQQNSGATARSDDITVTASSPSQLLQVPLTQVGADVNLVAVLPNPLSPSGGERPWRTFTISISTATRGRRSPMSRGSPSPRRPAAAARDSPR